MTWFKVDDNLAFHQKTLRAGNAAMGMWVRAGSWSMQQLSDGFVPDDMAVLLGGHKLADKLVQADLWVRGVSGYRFHQWSGPGRQRSREQVEQERDAAHHRKERWKEHRGNAVPDADGTLPRPDQTRPTTTDLRSHQPTQLAREVGR